MNPYDSRDTTRSGVPVTDLERLAAYFETADCVERSDLSIGDRLIVVTLNSVYTMENIGDGKWSVRGGWFDLNGLSPATVRINGCGFGGSVINQRVIAGNGLRIEFDNRVVTTTIRRFTIWRLSDSKPN